MAEVRRGVRHLLAKPLVYDFFQRAVGAYAWRRRVIDRLVNPLLRPGDRVIDIGCGTAEILRYLPPDIIYFGFDRNDEYIDSARRRFEDRNANFACESVGHRTGDKYAKFDLAIAAGLIHHLDDTETLAFLEDARFVLKKEGVLVLITEPIYTPSQSKAARYMVSKDRGQNVRTPEDYLAIYRKVFDHVDSEIDMQPLRIPYTGMAARCSTAPLPALSA